MALDIPVTASPTEMQPKAKYLEAVLRTSIEVNNAADFGEALKRVLQIFVEMAVAKSGSVMVMNEKTGLLEPCAWFGGCWEKGRTPRPFRVGEGIAGFVAETLAPYSCHDVRRDPHYRESDDSRSYDVRSLISVPIISSVDSLLGVINVDGTEVGAFDKQVKARLVELASYLAGPLEKAKLLDDMRQKAEALRKLNSIGANITRMAKNGNPPRDLPEILQAVVEAAVEIIEADSGTIHFAYDRRRQGYKFERWAGDRLAGEKGWAFLDRYPPRPWGIGHRAIEEKEIVSISDPAELKQWHRQLYKEGLQAIVCCPVTIGSELEGVLYLHFWDRPHIFTQTELELVQLLTNTALIAVQNALLFEESQSRLKERDLSLEIGHVIIETGEDMSALLYEITCRAVKVVGGDACANAFLYDPARESWERKFSHRQQYGEQGTVGDERCPRPNGMGAWVLQHQQERISYSHEEIHPDKVAEGAQSAICLPLKYRQEIVGLLYVYLKEAGRFSRTELRLLWDFADSAAIAIKNAQLVRDLRRNVQALTDLQDITVAFSAQWDLGTILDMVVESAVSLTGADRGWIKLVGVEQTTSTLDEILQQRAWRGFDESYMQLPLLPGRGISGMVVLTGEPALVANIRTYWADHPEIVPGDTPQETQSKLVVPLKVVSNTIGALNLESNEEGFFSHSDVQLLMVMADHAAMALTNAVIAEIDKLVGSSLDLDVFLDLLLDIALLMTDGQYGTFRLMDKEAKELALVASRGDRVIRERLKVEEPESIVGRVAAQKSSFRIPDLTESPWLELYSPITKEVEMRSLLAIPLLGGGGEIEGVFNIESPRPDAFSEVAEQLMTALAARATLAIQRAKLLQANADISSALVLSDERELFRVIVKQARDLLNVPVCAIWRWDESNPNELVLGEAVGREELGPEYSTLGLDSLIGKAIQDNRGIHCADVTQDRHFRRPAVAKALGWVSALIVPLSTGADKPFGALSVYTFSRREFARWERALLQALGQHAAAAIQSAQQLHQLTSAQQQEAVSEVFEGIGLTAANLVHRLNNKIGAIKARIQSLEAQSTMQQHPLPDGKLQEIARIAEEAVAIIQEWEMYVGDMKRIPLKRIDVQDCITSALESLPIPEGVRVVQIYDDVPLSVIAREELGIVFLNIFKNAVEAMGDRGELRIRGRSEQEWVEVAISDTGLGISEMDLDKLFCLGFSTKGARGIGLWWARMFVIRFGGEILVESVVGEGSTFTVGLPLAKE